MKDIIHTRMYPKIDKMVLGPKFNFLRDLPDNISLKYNGDLDVSSRR